MHWRTITTAERQLACLARKRSRTWGAFPCTILLLVSDNNALDDGYRAGKCKHGMGKGVLCSGTGPQTRRSHSHGNGGIRRQLRGYASGEPQLNSVEYILYSSYLKIIAPLRFLHYMRPKGSVTVQTGSKSLVE